MIIGGALSNLIERARHSGYFVDLISFRIPQIGFYFAIFNLADAAISVGVFLLFITVLFGGLRRSGEMQKSADTQNIDDNQAAKISSQSTKSTTNGTVSRPKKQHSQS